MDLKNSSLGLKVKLSDIREFREGEYDDIWITRDQWFGLVGLEKIEVGEHIIDPTDPWNFETANVNLLHSFRIVAWWGQNPIRCKDVFFREREYD